jgi:hypothetical protein
VGRAVTKTITWRQMFLVSASLGALFAVCYARLTATDLQFGDGGWLTLAAATNGVAHPPGYPLWIVLAHALTLLPFGTIPFRAGLLSVLCDAGTVAIVCATGMLLTRNMLAGLFAGALLGSTPLFVTWSIQPEVFALNNLLASAIVLCLLVPITRLGHWWVLVVACALLGLGLANQQTIIALAPLLLAAFWYKRSEFLSRNQALSVGSLAVIALAAGFCLPYIHTLVASQHALPWPFQTAHNSEQLIALITRKLFGTGSLAPNTAFQGGALSSRLGVTVVALCPVLPVVALSAVFTDDSKLRLWIPAVWAAVVAFAFCVVANINLDNGLLTSIFTRFALLPLVLLAPYAAFALSACARLLHMRSRAAMLTNCALVAIVVAGGLTYAQTRSLHDQHDTRAFVDDVFAGVPRGAVLLLWDDLYTQSIPYFQIVEGLRPDVSVVALPFLLHDETPDYTVLVEREGIALGDVASSASGIAARDAIARANPARTMFLAGWGPMTAHTLFTVSKFGLTGLVSAHPNATRLATFYAENSTVMRGPGYGAVSSDTRQHDVWHVALTAQYGEAFFSMGLYAESVGDAAAAQQWFSRALTYLPDDPDIQGALRRETERQSGQ